MQYLELLAGGLAILAPILRPIAGSVKLSRPSMAVLMQAAGEEALILGPFAPPVVALLGVTGISYGSMLLYASIPIALVTIVVTWVMASRLQVQYAHETFPHDATEERFVPTPRQKHGNDCLYFSIHCLCCLWLNFSGKNFLCDLCYVIFVSLTGTVGGLRIGKVFQLLVEGMKKNFHLFFIFFCWDLCLIWYKSRWF